MRKYLFSLQYSKKYFLYIPEFLKQGCDITILNFKRDPWGGPEKQGFHTIFITEDENL